MPPPHPAWFTAINWSAPVPVENVRLNRTQVPDASGVYVFTKHDKALVDEDRGVLYVGMSTTSIRSRVSTYMSDPEELDVHSKKKGAPHLSSQLKHPGKALILMEIQQVSRGGANSNIWVRWHTCAGAKQLEDQLIAYLEPAFNSA